jgi:hypothetical protein
VKVAIHQTGPVAGRCAEILLAEADLTLLGVLGQDPERSKITRVRHLSEWDVVVSDAVDATEALSKATSAGIPLAVRGTVSAPVRIPVFADASLAALARAIASTRNPRLVAITVPGAPLRSGAPVSFPPPVGRLHSNPRPDGLVVAPTSGDWSGIVVETTSEVVGVADQRAFLDAIALAAAAIVMATEPHEVGLVDVTSIADRYLGIAEAAGLEIASFRPATAR